MEEQKAGSTLEFSHRGLGCMAMTGFYGACRRDVCIQTIQSAFEQGISLFDTADSYGFGENEILLGSAIAPFRNQVTVATKVGVVRNREAPNSVSINGRADYIKEHCTASLKRLCTQTIDLYYLHHPDPNTPIEESIEAMKELIAEGKVRQIGLCEMAEELIRRAQKVHPIAAIQAEYSLFSRDAETTIIPLCQELGIRFVACAPLCRGLLSGSISSFHELVQDDFRRHFPRFSDLNLAHNSTIVSDLKKMAQAKSCTLAQLALSWIYSQSSSFVPLFGTTRSDHLLENLQKAPLTLEEIAAMNALVSQLIVRGSRHPEMVKSLYNTKD